MVIFWAVNCPPNLATLLCGDGIMHFTCKKLTNQKRHHLHFCHCTFNPKLQSERVENNHILTTLMQKHFDLHVVKC